MFKHILIGTDGSELAQKAETAGLTLAKELDVPVTIVTVTEPWEALSMSALAERGLPNPVADYDEAVATTANLILWTNTQPRVSSRRPSNEDVTSSSWLRMAGAAFPERCSAARRLRSSL